MLTSTDICEAMVLFADKFDQIGVINDLQVEHFTDGVPFAIMLIDANCLQLSLSELEQHSTKWITKVSNLKKVLFKIHKFLESVNQKPLKILDIDVVQIAKHNSVEHIANYFQLVTTVLMNSTEKQRYIQLIMSMDEKTQNTFVSIIQNSLDQKLFQSQKSNAIINMESQMKQIKSENGHLKIEIGELNKKNKHLTKEVKDFRDKICMYQQQLEQIKMSNDRINSDSLQTQIEQQSSMIDNLKEKLITTVREGQIENSRLRDEIYSLHIKSKNTQQLKNTLDIYKQRYSESMSQIQRHSQCEKDKRRLNRLIEEKEMIIKKLQYKIDTTIQKNYSMQENEFYMKIEFEKRENRFKQLEKQVKTTRLKSQPCQVIIKPDLMEFKIEEEKDEINYLHEQLLKTKNHMKQVEKENIKNRKRLEKMNQLENQKKKLQKIIHEVNRCKDCQIQMLVSSLFQLRNQNIKMYELLKEMGEKR